MNKELLIKLEKKKNNNFRVKPIFQNDENKFLFDEFLKEQNFLNINEVLAILSISFLKNEPIGYVLIKDEKKIVGFLGTIFSKRTIAEKLVEHCYLHSWVVSEEFRLEAFKLIIPIIKKDTFISTFSPVKSLEGLYKKFGFEENQFFSKFVIFFPVKRFKKISVTLNENSSFFRKYLSNKDLNLLNDHKKTNVEQMFFHFNNNIDDNILIMIKKSQKFFFFSVLEIIHISDLKKFRLHEKEIIFELMKRFRTLVFKFNYLGENNIFSENYLFTKITKKNVYYYNKPINFKFDVLYSELVG